MKHAVHARTHEWSRRIQESLHTAPVSNIQRGHTNRGFRHVALIGGSGRRSPVQKHHRRAHFRVGKQSVHHTVRVGPRDRTLGRPVHIWHRRVCLDETVLLLHLVEILDQSSPHKLSKQASIRASTRLIPQLHHLKCHLSHPLVWILNGRVEHKQRPTQNACFRRNVYFLERLIVGDARIQRELERPTHLPQHRNEAIHVDSRYAAYEHSVQKQIRVVRAFALKVVGVVR